MAGFLAFALQHTAGVTCRAGPPTAYFCRAVRAQSPPFSHHLFVTPPQADHAALQGHVHLLRQKGACGMLCMLVRGALVTVGRGVVLVVVGGCGRWFVAGQPASDPAHSGEGRRTRAAICVLRGNGLLKRKRHSPTPLLPAAMPRSSFLLFASTASPFRLLRPQIKLKCAHGEQI